MKKSFQLFKITNIMNAFSRVCLLVTGLLLLHLSVSAQWAWKETGNASYYADKFHGRSTASGERYNKNELTAAHRTLPMGSIVRVTHARNGQSVEVRINDCGPHRSDRVIDISKAAAKKIQLIADGVAPVMVELVEPGDGHCACDRKKKWDPAPWKTKGVVIAKETEVTATVKPEQTPAPRKEKKQPDPVAETAPEPPVAPELPSAGIVLQLGAFGNVDNAKNLVQKINNQGFSDVFVKEFPQGDKTLYRVYRGLFVSRAEAETAQKELKEKVGIDGVVTELK